VTITLVMIFMMANCDQANEGHWGRIVRIRE